MTREELLPYLDGDIAEVLDTQRLWPLTCCWPMGHSFSAAVAQHTLLVSVRLAGFHSDQLLHDEYTLPHSDRAQLALAIDDVNIFERGAWKDLRSQPAVIERLDEVWDDLSIKCNRDKSVDRSSDQTVLGMDIVKGKLLMPKRSKLALIVLAVRDIIAHPWTSPRDFTSFIGSVTWVLLSNRALLSVFSAVYLFIQDECDTIVRRLPEHAVDE